MFTGTTDNPCDVTFQPAPTEKEIQFILNEVRNYLHPDVEGKVHTDIVNHQGSPFSCPFINKKMFKKSMSNT